MASEFESMEDLAFSRSFRNWVLNRDSNERGYWEDWIARNPDKAEMVKYAKAVIYALAGNTVMLPEDEIDEEVRKALARLKEAPRYIPLDSAESHAVRWTGLMRLQRIWAWAALLAAIGLGGYFLYRIFWHRDVLKTFLNAHQKEVVRQQVADVIDDQTFNLPDGSLVRLEKTGKLYYPGDWVQGQARREVYLDGTAYFDIRKNAAAPFFVYTDQVIVKALGTSFIIHAATDRTSVTAVTGAISVYRQEDFFSHSAVGHEPAGMVLTPNQSGVYDRADDRLHRTLVQTPEPVGEKPDSGLVFRNVPVRVVFARLQELYEIPIRYDEGAVDHCMVTVTLGKEPYYGQLNAICNAIGGSYEVIDGNVVVTASGCK